MKLLYPLQENHVKIFLTRNFDPHSSHNHVVNISLDYSINLFYVRRVGEGLARQQQQKTERKKKETNKKPNLKKYISKSPRQYGKLFAQNNRNFVDKWIKNDWKENELRNIEKCEVNKRNPINK